MCGWYVQQSSLCSTTVFWRGFFLPSSVFKALIENIWKKIPSLSLSMNVVQTLRGSDWSGMHAPWLKNIFKRINLAQGQGTVLILAFVKLRICTIHAFPVRFVERTKTSWLSRTQNFRRPPFISVGWVGPSLLFQTYSSSPRTLPSALCSSTTHSSYWLLWPWL